MRLIDADKLESDMYHNAFEINTDLQKWDSGCWIRYKMFENVIDEQPTAKAISIKWINEWLSKFYKEINGVLFYTGDGYDSVEDMLKDWEEENGRSE